MSTPNFIGFEPAEFNEGMKTLSNVIKLRAKAKDEVEAARGYEASNARDNAARAKPINDEIAKQNALMLTYNSTKDITDVKLQIRRSKSLKDEADAIAARTNDQGDAALATVYGLQLDYAKAKLVYLEAMRDLANAKTPKERVDKTKAADDAIAAFQDALGLFTKAEIPVGFVQATDIRTLPVQPMAQPGSQSQAIVVAKKPVLIGSMKKTKMIKTIEEMYDTQYPSDPAIAMEQDIWGTGGLAFIASPGSPGQVGIMNQDDGRITYGRVENGLVVFPDAPGFVTTPEIMTEILKNDYDRMSADAIQFVLSIYFTAFKIPPIIKVRLPIPDPNDATKTIPGPEQEAINDLGTAVELFQNNPNYEFVRSILLKQYTGSGILGDLVKKAARVVAPKRGAKGPPMKRPKLMGDMFGNVRVDLPALHNQQRIRVFNGGKVVMDESEENVDGFGLKRLMMTRVMQKTLDSAPTKVLKQYERLLKLANAEQSKTSGTGVKKSPKRSLMHQESTAKKPQIILVGDGADLAQRLKIAVGEYGAGNTSSENVQLITELAFQMMKLGKISSDRYKAIVESVA